MRAASTLAVVLLIVGAPAFGADLVGRWDFENSLAPTTGSSPLTSALPAAYVPVTINGVNGYAATWAQGTPAGADQQFFTVNNAIGANGGGALTNQYTVVMDVNFPAPGANGGYTSLVQTNATPGATDGDLFVRGDGGAGISSDYSDTGNALRFPYGEWVRLVWSVDTTAANGYRVFYNGQLHNVVQSPSGWAVDMRYALGNALHVFADEDGETNGGSISTLMFYNGALNDGEVAALGGAVAAVPEPSALALAGLAALPLLARRRR